MTRPTVLVLCVDDNRLLADEIERRIAFDPSLEWVGWVHDSGEAAEVVRRVRPDVVLLDIDMPRRE